MGLFDEINEIADVHIDDFEEEEIIEQQSLQKILEFLVNFRVPIDLQHVKSELMNLFKDAINRDTGVFFFF